MKVAFLAADKRRERLLARAFIDGVRRCGDEGEALTKGDNADDYDVVCLVGVKSLDDWLGHGERHRIMLDKGYSRHRLKGTKDWEYWRVAVDGHHPTRYLMDRPKPAARFEGLGMDIAPWRRDGSHILIAGSSAKYHRFYGLPDPTTYASNLVAEIRKYTDRPILYRPKPSWTEAQKVPGAIWSDPQQSINGPLRDAWALVTHGSNACFEAALAGVPSIVLGDAIARPISSTRIAEIAAPKLASREDRRQWFANLAYCQWTLKEFASGEAWAHMREAL